MNEDRNAQRSAFDLLNASFESLQAGRLEDAFFEFYAGKVRRQMEMGLFPPDSFEGAAKELQRMESELSEMFHQLVLGQPVAIVRAMDRFDAWAPAVGANTVVMWPSSRRADPAAVWPVIADLKQRYSAFNRGVAVLVQQPAYWSALQVVRGFGKHGQKYEPPLEEFVTNMQAMHRIERAQGIRGIRGIATQYAEEAEASGLADSSRTV